VSIQKGEIVGKFIARNRCLGIIGGNGGTYMKRKRVSLGTKLRRDFAYGLILVLPVVATVWLVIFMIQVISGPLSTLFAQKIPTPISFLLTLVLITVVGLLGRNFLGKALFKYTEYLISRIPVINNIYRSTTQIVNAFTMKDKAKMSPVLLEYPRPGAWALGFVTRSNVTGLLNSNGVDLGEGMVAVFVPTTPNPTSGYFIYVKEVDIHHLKMSVEESIKVLMSAGVVNPETAYKAEGV
jgi:uncharacterized membrane protein